MCLRLLLINIMSLASSLWAFLATSSWSNLCVCLQHGLRCRGTNTKPSHVGKVTW